MLYSNATPLPPNHTHNHCRDKDFIVNEAEVLKIVFEKTEDFSSAILKEQVAECLRQIVWNTQCFFAEDVLLKLVSPPPPQTTLEEHSMLAYLTAVGKISAEYR